MRSVTRRPAIFMLAASTVAIGIHCERRASQAPTPTPALTPPTPAAPSPATAAAEGAQRLTRILGELSANPALREVNRLEDTLAQVERDILRPWASAWRRHDAAAMQPLLARDATTPAWSRAVRSATRLRDGTQEFTLSAPAGAELQGAAYLQAFARIVALSLRADRISVEGDDATLHLRFDLRGLTPQQTRRQDRGALTLSAHREGVTWKITSIAIDGALESLESAPGRRPTFEDLTVASGLGAIPVVERREAIRRGGYAIAVNDLNGDGRVDVLVGHADSAQLWRNVGGGRFVDATAELGIQGVTLVKSAAIADLDRDGRRDLLLVRFVDTHAPEADDADDPLNGRGGDGEVLGFANRGGRFERVQRVLQRGHHYDRAMPLSVADFDADGTLDLYLGFPGVRDFTNNLARTGGRPGRVRQGLWRNEGAWRFVESPLATSLMSDTHRFPHASLATDLDGDGRPDLVVVDDSGGANVVYRNRGAAMQNASADMRINARGWGMGVASGDFDGDGDVDLAMTNIASSAGDRVLSALLRGSLAPEAERSIRQDLEGNRGLRLYRNNGQGVFEEVSEAAGMRWAGEAPAGAEWIDFNHDGHLDLYVANGLWTGAPDGDDVSSVFFRLAAGRTISRDTQPDSAMSGPEEVNDPNPMLTILRSFRGRVSAPGATLADAPTLSMDGREHNRLFRNNGDGSFTEVGFFEGADRVEDGYVIAPGDVDGDGVEDLVLRNCDPAPGQRFPVVVYLRNTRSDAHTLRVSLRGVTDNLDGVGARVTVRVGQRTLVREVRAANGAAQGETVASFGLGDARSVESVEVRWPSGAVQSLGRTPEGSLTITQSAPAAR